MWAEEWKETRGCMKDGIALVNTVRKPEQAGLLQVMGARHIDDSSAPAFMDDLTEALQPEHIAVYGQRTTGTKYLINPSKG